MGTQMSNLDRQDRLLGYIFISPQVIGYLIFVLYPLIAIMVFSLQDYNLLSGVREWIGFENYQTMFSENSLFLKTLKNSLVFTAGLVPLNVILALFLANLLTKPIKGVTAFRVLVFAPVITSAVAWAIVWKFMLDGENGIINQLLALVNITGPNWLRSPTWAMVSIIVVRVLKNVGLNVVLFTAALMSVPPQFAESASIDGANSRQVFFRITLPQIMPSVMMVLIVTLIGSLKVFDHIMVLTAGGPGNSTMVLVYYIYYQAFQFSEPGSASGGAVVLFLVALFLTLLQWNFRKRMSYQET